jgi:hypothetical protein
MSFDDRACFLEAYWSALEDLIPEAMASPEKRKEDGEEFGKRFARNFGRKADEEKDQENSRRKEKYLLLSALGIYVAHRIARDFLHSAIREGVSYKQKEFFKSKLNPIKSFDWKASTSPLAALGGMKGVSKAYDLLSEIIGQEKYPAGPKETLVAYSERRQGVLND